MSRDEVEMKVAVSEGIRRLPIYLLLDTSSSMAGAPIQAVRQGVEQFKREVEKDTFARDTTYIGVITFASEADYVTGGLIPIESFQPPDLEAQGSTSMGKALTLLVQSLDKDVKAPVKGGEKGDWKPLVFILTDGEPTDEWQSPRQAILDRQQRKVLNVITVGCGPFINEQNLKDIAIGPTFQMDASEASFRAFFQWVSQSVTRVSKVVSQPGEGEQPLQIPTPPPDVLQYIP